MHIPASTRSILLVLFFVTAPFAHAAAPPFDLPGAARAVLQRHCARCHERPSYKYGGLNHITDLHSLVSRRLVVPGKLLVSRLYQRILDGEMPPLGKNNHFTVADRELLRRWIRAGAPAGRRANSRRYGTHSPRSSTACRGIRVSAYRRPSIPVAWSFASTCGSIAGPPGNGTGWAPDGKTFASAGEDGTIRVWNVADGSHLPMAGRMEEPAALAFSPDGRRPLAGGADRVLVLWDATTGRRVARLVGHTAGIRAVAFSRDGKLMLSAGEDRAVRVWDLATKALKISYEFHLELDKQATLGSFLAK